MCFLFLKAAATERYIMDNSISLGYDKDDRSASERKIWHDPNTSDTMVHQEFTAHLKDLNEKFTRQPRRSHLVLISCTPFMKKGDTGICKTARLHPDGLEALFPNSEFSHGYSGFLELLTTPMRHPN